MQKENSLIRLNIYIYRSFFKILILLCCLAFFNNLIADGTKQVSPLNNTNGTALYISPSSSTGSYLGALSHQRIQFTIADNNNENLYFGLHPRTFSNFNTTLVTNAYYRIYDSGDNLVAGPTLLPTSGNGFIATYTQASSGPNIGGLNPTGYSPITFDPSTDGDFYVVLYRSNNGGTNMEITLPITFPFFDFTVATALNVQMPGRLWCKKWAFVSCDISNVNFPNPLSSSITGKFFGYTPDQFVVDIQFQAGFRPLGFDFVLTDYGVNNNGNFLTDRKSINTNLSTPTFANGYKSFLTRPDSVSFPNGQLGSALYSGSFLGCLGNYFIPYSIDQSGDVSLVINLDGVPGYNTGTTDVILESYGLSAGGKIMRWNGNDGFGNPVTIGSIAEITVTLYQGRTNLPTNDAELNTNGYTVGAVFPALGSRKMYWDDTNISAFGTCGVSTNNVTFGGVNLSGTNSGIVGPNHAWDGSNPNTTVPALPGGQGSSTLSIFCDDYGNTRAINTWFYANDFSTPPVLVTIQNCNTDADIDLVLNNSDLDDDNDGVPDTSENGVLNDPFADDDVDGIPNYLDVSQIGFRDNNADAIDDQYDLDRDGKLNIFDIDADNDGLTDAIEAGGADTNGNGILDGFIDVNNNGLNDLADPSGGGTPLPTENTDSQNGANYLDIDSDNDGIVDNIEAQSTATFIAPVGNDTDGDGLDDSYDLDNSGIVIIIANSDGVDNPDYLDLSADNDFYFDAVEGWDYDGDNFADVIFSGQDLDGDGLDDNYDSDDFSHNPTNGQTPVSFPNLDTPLSAELDWREFIAILNFPPTAANDSLVINEDDIAIINITVNDSDSDGTIDLSTVDLDPSFTGIQNSYPVSGEGNYTVDINGNVTFTPVQDFNGIAAPLNYRVTDNGGALSNIAQLKIIVLSVNDNPISETDTATTVEDSIVVFNVLVNDYDVDGTIDPPTIDLDSITSGIQNFFNTAEGNWLIDSLGNITFTPAPNFNGSATISYIANDNEGATTNTSLIIVAVLPVNDSPQVDNEVLFAFEDNVITGNLIDIGDTDIDGILSANATPLENPENGTITINIDGTYTYTPDLNFNGADTIVVQICDDGSPLPSICVENKMFITIGAVNDAPFLVNNFISIVQNGSSSGNLINAGDSDPDSTFLVVNTIPIDAPNNGSIAINIDGSFTLVPDVGFIGNDTVVVQICDQGLPLPSICSNDTIFISVAATTPPFADNNSDTTNEDTPVTFNITNTDTDSDGFIDSSSADLDTFTAGIQNSYPTAEGLWNVDSLGNVTFTPMLNFNGAATNNYTVNDNDGATSNEAILTVTVNPINDPPNAISDSASTASDNPVSFSLVLNDTDIDGTINTNTVDLDQIANGIQNTFSAVGEGDYLVDNNGSITFTPVDTFSGFTSQLSYTVQDNNLAISNNATITINVAANVPPIATNDNASGFEDFAISINVTANDSDTDGSIDVSTIDLDSITIGLQTNALVVGEGSYTANNLGFINFIPALNYNGTTSPIYYTINDNLGATSNTATLAIVVSPQNDSPVATNDTIITNEDTSVSGNIVLNDIDGDGSIAANTVDLNTSTPGIQDSASILLEGIFLVSNLGELTFTPFLNFNGTTSPLNYTVQDNNGLGSNFASIVINVAAINDAPIAMNNSGTTNEETSITINVTTNDTDIDGTINAGTVDLDPLTINIQNTFSVSNQGFYAVDASGSITFNPSINFTGNTTPLIYTVNDNSGLTSNPATFSINVLPVNDAPFAIPDSAITNEDAAVTFNVTTNDTDVDGTIAVGTVDLNTGSVGIQNTFTVINEGTYAVNNLGELTYTPALNFNGLCTPINYTVQDNAGATSNIGIINITINAVNDPPIVFNEITNTTLNTTLSTNATNGILANGDFDIDGTQLVINTSPIVLPANGSISLNTDGSYIYTPNLDYTGQDIVVIEICDAGLPLPALCINDTLLITVSNSLPPITISNNYTVVEDNSLVVVASSGIISNGDADPEAQALSVSTTFVNAPLSGSAVLNPDGSFTYTPNENFFGNDSFVVNVCDPQFVCTEDTVFIVVSSINDTPEANNDGNNGNEDTEIVINLVANDTDVDGSIATSSVDLDLITAGLQSSVSINGSGICSVDVDGLFTFVPLPNYNGTVLTSYTVNDNNGLASNIAFITMEIFPINDSPVISNDEISINEDSQAIGSIINANDFDIDTTSLVANTVAINGPFNGDIMINSDGTFAYTPTPNFFGMDMVVIEICDSGNPLPSICTFDTLTINVISINDSLFALDDNYTIDEDTDLQENLSENDSDIDAEELFYTLYTNPTNGTAIVNGDGTIVYSPLSNYSGSDLFSYIVCDDGIPAFCDTANVTININPVNDSIISFQDFIVLYTGTSNITFPNQNNIDPDNNLDSNSFSIVNNVDNGTAVLNNDGSIDYTPNTEFIGLDTLIINICDLGIPIYCSNDTIVYNVIQGSVLGVAKSVVNSVIQLDGSYNLEFKVVIENLGNEILADIQLVENLSLAFPLPSAYSIVSSPANSGSLIVNTLFNGSTDTNLLVSSVSSLLAGEVDTVSFVINLQPNDNFGPFNNSIFGTAIGLDTETLATDVSTNGNNTDPNNNGLPEEAEVTVINLSPNYSIGIAKTTSLPELQLDGTYNLTLTFDITNFGNAEATNIQATDNLLNTFTGTATFEVIFVQVLGGGLEANTNFNGNSDIELLNSSESSLLSGESEIINVILNFNPNEETGPFNNTANATTSEDGGTILSADNSVNGTDPDPNGDGIPDEESITPILFEPINNSIGLSKALTNIEAVTDSTFNLTFGLIVANFGNTSLSNIQVTDNLIAAFPLPAIYNIVSLTSSGLQVNSSYNGEAEIGLLANIGNTLEAGSVDTITLVINLNPNNDSITFFNSAIAFSYDEFENLIVSDTSVDGQLPDPNNDGIPDENSLTAISFGSSIENNSIGLAKELTSFEALGNGIFNITYSFRLKNHGNTILSNIQVTDSLETNFEGVDYSIISLLTTDNLVINNSFDGENEVGLLSELQSSLLIGDSATITLVVQIITSIPSDTLNNISIAFSKDNFGNIVTTDVSVNGIFPDPDGNGIPSEFSLTPFIYNNQENTYCLGISKEVKTVVAFIDNSYNVTYRITLENFCADNLTDLQVVDNLSLVFENPASFILQDDLFASNNLTINQNYNGTTDINLLSSNNSSLAAGTNSYIEFTITFFADTIFIPSKEYSFSNNAFGSAIKPSGEIVNDNSVNGNDPDPDENGIPSEDGMTIFTIRNVDSPPNLSITDAFSPNDDGVNDLFVINGLNYFYPKNNLKVFNRWGNLVFEKNNYQNDWNAIANAKGILIGSEKLPEGTYFYLLDIGFEKAIEGFLVIKY
jgi:gliding motility-associated-like protein